MPDGNSFENARRLTKPDYHVLSLRWLAAGVVLRPVVQCLQHVDILGVQCSFRLKLSAIECAVCFAPLVTLLY